MMSSTQVGKTEVILTTSESLKNRMIDCRALKTYFGSVEIVVFDEIHLMEGHMIMDGILVFGYVTFSIQEILSMALFSG